MASRLAVLAEQLRLYKAPAPVPVPEEVEDDETISEVGFRPKKAAVLICLFQQNNDDRFRVILTKRSSTLSTHSGEVSLPGGKAEEDDVDDAYTATREAKEEIGLDPSLVDVVTLLDPFLSKHLLQVIPVIGILSDANAFKPTPNAAEVDDVFDAPLEMFLKDENRRCETREWMGDEYLVHYFEYETGGKKYLIWGLTAGILIRAASVVYQRPPDFLEQSPKFKVPSVLNKDMLMV
ncbi:hypothetical protein QVD17_30024 [Tagetes erecta]|uniref:Nudix hydrolase domain-containing protein n=1 Tax=Tagetes erecta TaxID=13708 RepID=A0AAD8K758_TARER|nr:hypothetical protein QVD17_30024 [Tagetes erecta]